MASQLISPILACNARQINTILFVKQKISGFCEWISRFKIFWLRLNTDGIPEKLDFESVIWKFFAYTPRYMTIQILQKRYRVDCRYQSHIKKDEDVPFLCTVVYYRNLADNFLNLVPILLIYKTVLT